MRLHPVKASEWLTISEANRQLLRSCGAVPVNDVFYEHFGNDADIWLMYGGYGSGKSVTIVDHLLDKCMNTSYFKCYYGRKVFDTVRGSCFETITDRINELDLKDEFYFSDTPNGSMVIQHKSGNKFIPFGSDKADKLKSIKDPTHIWCEEFDQFEDGTGDKQGDFQLLYPRLRTTKAKTQFIASFNTAPIMPDHWILKYFFPDLYQGDEGNEDDVLDGVKVLKVFSNFRDNYFIDKEAYFNQLRVSSGGDDKVLAAIADGDWGAKSEGLLFPTNELTFYNPATVTAKTEHKAVFVDPADKGGDYYAAPLAYLIGDIILIDRVIFSTAGVDVTIPETVDMITSEKVDSVQVEINGGWTLASKDIKKEVHVKHPNCNIRSVSVSTNKETRILTQSSWIKRYVRFREDYRSDKQYSAFMKNLTSYLREGKNAHDDAADVMAQLAEWHKKQFSHLW